MNDLFGGVVYAGIDTDRFKYPIGSGRVTFGNQRSFMKAVKAGFVDIKTTKFTKKVGWCVTSWYLWFHSTWCALIRCKLIHTWRTRCAQCVTELLVHISVATSNVSNTSVVPVGNGNTLWMVSNLTARWHVHPRPADQSDGLPPSLTCALNCGVKK